MNFSLLGILTILGMLGGTLCMLEIGRRFAARRLAVDPEGAKAGTGVVEGAVFGLMGLLVAFTFSGAAARFDARRAMIVEEANCISTAWLRLDMLPSASQPSLRAKFRQYLEARLAVFRKIPNMTAMKLELDRVATLQNEIWTQALSACRESAAPTTTMLLVPALNQMFDTATSRTAGIEMHPPMLIYGTLGLLLLASALLAGYGLGVGKIRDTFHGLSLVLVMTVTVYVILDFEFPRVGIIRIDRFEQALVELQQSMKP